MTDRMTTLRRLAGIESHRDGWTTSKAVAKPEPKAEAKAAKPDPVAKLAAKLAQMTDDNDHTGAVIELAKFSKDKDLLKAAQGIEMIHAGMGSMPYEVSTFRNFLHKQIIAAITDTQGKAVADTLDKAF